MALQEIKQCGSQLTDADIIHIERALGVSLLPEHKQLLLEHNGGVPVPSYLHVSVSDMKSLKVDSIYGFGGDFDIVRANSYAKKRLPKGAVVFAGDDGGGSFFFVMDGRNRGEVRFLDEGSGRSKTHFVSTSLAEMFGMLRPSSVG